MIFHHHPKSASAQEEELEMLVRKFTHSNSFYILYFKGRNFREFGEFGKFSRMFEPG